MIAVQVENLYKRFPGIDALAGFCFSLPKEKFAVCLVEWQWGNQRY